MNLQRVGLVTGQTLGVADSWRAVPLPRTPGGSDFQLVIMSHHTKNHENISRRNKNPNIEIVDNTTLTMKKKNENKRKNNKLLRNLGKK